MSCIFDLQQTHRSVLGKHPTSGNGNKWVGSRSRLSLSPPHTSSATKISLSRIQWIDNFSFWVLIFFPISSLLHEACYKGGLTAPLGTTPRTVRGTSGGKFLQLKSQCSEMLQPHSAHSSPHPEPALGWGKFFKSECENVSVLETPWLISNHS